MIPPCFHIQPHPHPDAGEAILCGPQSPALCRIMENAEHLLVIPPNLFDQAKLECEIYRAARRLGVGHVVKLKRN